MAHPEDLGIMSDARPSTFDPSVRLGEAGAHHVLVKRRLLYAITSTFLALLVGLAVVDGIAAVDVYGVDTSVARNRGGGYELEVRHATVSRPGLATPFDIRVTRPGGFDGPVTVTVSSHYIGLFDENGLNPEPSATTNDGTDEIWEFDPPPDGSETFEFSLDARVDPSLQTGRSCRVAILDADDDELVGVEFSTRILP